MNQFIVKYADQIRGKLSGFDGLVFRGTLRYLQSSKDDKEAIARSITRERKITEGPVRALTCVEPCWGFDIYRNAETQKLDLV